MASTFSVGTSEVHVTANLWSAAEEHGLNAHGRVLGRLSGLTGVEAALGLARFVESLDSQFHVNERESLLHAALSQRAGACLAACVLNLNERVVVF